MSKFGRFWGVLVLFLLVVACGEDPPSLSPGNATEAPSRLVRGNGGEPGTLDPGLAEDIHAFNIIADLYEGLVATDANGRIIAGVAKTWDISADGLTYTFHLRDDARWSNGDDVVAKDFVRAFAQATDPGSIASLGFLLEPVEETAQTSERELVIRLKRPTSYFLSILTMPVAMPIHSTKQHARDGQGEHVTNGAFRRQKSSKRIGVVDLERNPFYWDAENVAIDEVRYLPVVDEYAELNQFRTGEIHITQSIPDSAVAQLRESAPQDVRVSPMLALYYLAFDMTEPPFDNVNVRRALSMAIDRETLAELLGRGELPAYSIVPPGTTGRENAGYGWRTQDQADRLAEARDLLAAAGYKEGTPLRFTYLYDAGGIHEKVALAVGAMWQSALAVEVDYEKREWQYFLQTRDQRDEWQLMRFSWFGDYDDPDTFLQIFSSESSQNLPRLVNPDFDRVLQVANTLIDATERFEALARAEELLLAEYPVAPLYFLVSKHLVHPSVRGFEQNVLDRHPTRFMSLD
jgi:ABC-type oligopeptide transport system substrate-binding subunit